MQSIYRWTIQCATQCVGAHHSDAFKTVWQMKIDIECDAQPKLTGNFNCTIFLFFFFCRSTHEVVEIDKNLYALGGNDGSSSLNSVEKFDPQLNKWTVVNSMVTRRSSIGAAVLECFNLERGLVQTTNLWHLTNVPENQSSNGSTTSPPLSSSVPNT